MQVQEELKIFLFENGVADVGFTCVDDPSEKKAMR